MSVTKLDKPSFIFLAYFRGGTNDFLELKKTIIDIAENDPSQRDIIVHWDKNASILEDEIEVLSKVHKLLHGKRRYLKILANKLVKKKLEARGGFDRENLSIY